MSSRAVTLARAGVVGSPIGHSLSPLLHTRAYELLGIPARYEANEVRSGQLASYLAGLGPEWLGLSVTMPLKQEALALAHDVTATAARTGAVNTLVQRSGDWSGDNTDVHGIVESLRPHLDGAVGPALVVGSGATARSAVEALRTMGVEEVTFAVRDQARAETIDQARNSGMAVQVCRLDQASGPAATSSILISTVPAHGADGLATQILAREKSAAGVWLDVVYAGWPTALGTAGERIGATVVPGIDMLVHQAAAQVALMTGHTPPLEEMLRVGRAASGISQA